MHAVRHHGSLRMAKAGNWRGPRAPPKSNREREVENDVFEAEDSEPEEERLKNKYDVREYLREGQRWSQ